jgi:hypothetical protein
MRVDGSGLGPRAARGMEAPHRGLYQLQVFADKIHLLSIQAQINQPLLTYRYTSAFVNSRPRSASI